MVDLRRTWRVGVVVGVVLVAALGCGDSDSEGDDAAPATAPDRSEAAETTTTAPVPVGPIEIRLDGTRESDGYSYPETVRFLITGPCDGTGECTLARPDGAAGYGVPGWEAQLELDGEAYSYEGTETLTVDRCGDEVLTDELEATLALSVTPADGEPAVKVTESWAQVPQADMSDGSSCSGLSATVFTLG